MLSRTRLRVAAGTLLAAVAAVLALAAFSPAHASAISPTSLTLACSDEVTLAEQVTCVATVSGSEPSAPTGDVTFKTDHGRLTADCTLYAVSPAAAQCAVTVAGTDLGVGTYPIAAYYGGDALHSSSSSVVDVSVLRVSSSTSVTCSPDTVRVGESRTC